MYTLQQIKDQYYCDLASNDTERRSLEQYIRERFTHVYDGQLNFIGYESYISLTLKPYDGHIYEGTRQQQNRTERKRIVK